MRNLRTLLTVCCQLCVLLHVCADDDVALDRRRTLRVVLYPFIPAKTEYFRNVEHAFEAAETNVDLQIIDLAGNYYDKSKEGSVASADADVYELDSVILGDFVKGRRVHPLGELLPVKDGDYLKNAEQAAHLNGELYGIPHWVCGNFLFFRTNGAPPIGTVSTLTAFEKVIGTAKSSTNGVLVDLRGKLTLGEMYLDSAFDRYGDWAVVQTHLATLDPDIEGDLRRLLRLCTPGFGRNQRYHEATGFYGREFARGVGQMMIGYSEVLYYFRDEVDNACPDGECVPEVGIGVIELPLSDGGSHSVSWVDVLAVNSKCNGQKLKDAADFIKFVSSDNVVLDALKPAYGRPARHLLPAKRSLYDNAELLSAVPLYRDFKQIMERSYPPVGERLNDTLITYGKKLNEELDRP
jgi:thiamine pyridinylase